MKFEWIDFYSEFATKLLLFKNDRKALIERINDVYTAINMQVPKLESIMAQLSRQKFDVFIMN